MIVPPFLPWTGGKRRLLPKILPHLPDRIGRFVSPFLGGGAVELALLSDPAREVRFAELSDANPRLIRQWEYVRDCPEDVLSELARLEERQDHQQTKLEFNDRTTRQGEGHLIWLVCRSFSALYRENSSGYFNSPYDDEKRRPLPDEGRLLAVSEILRRKDVTLSCRGFRDALVERGDDRWAFCDPPYLGRFVGYCGGWSDQDTVDLVGLLSGTDAVLTETDTVCGLLPRGVPVDVEEVRKTHSNSGSRGLGTTEIVARFYADRPEW